MRKTGCPQSSNFGCPPTALEVRECGPGHRPPGVKQCRSAFGGVHRTWTRPLVGCPSQRVGPHGEPADFPRPSNQAPPARAGWRPGVHTLVTGVDTVKAARTLDRVGTSFAPARGARTREVVRLLVRVCRRPQNRSILRSHSKARAPSIESRDGPLRVPEARLGDRERPSATSSQPPPLEDSALNFGRLRFQSVRHRHALEGSADICTDDGRGGMAEWAAVVWGRGRTPPSSAFPCLEPMRPLTRSGPDKADGE